MERKESVAMDEQRERKRPFIFLWLHIWHFILSRLTHNIPAQYYAVIAAILLPLSQAMMIGLLLHCHIPNNSGALQIV